MYSNKNTAFGMLAFFSTILTYAAPIANGELSRLSTLSKALGAKETKASQVKGLVKKNAEEVDTLLKEAYTEDFGPNFALAQADLVAAQAASAILEKINSEKTIVEQYDGSSLKDTSSTIIRDNFGLSLASENGKLKIKATSDENLNKKLNKIIIQNMSDVKDGKSKFWDSLSENRKNEARTLVAIQINAELKDLLNGETKIGDDLRKTSKTISEKLGNTEKGRIAQLKKAVELATVTDASQKRRLEAEKAVYDKYKDFSGGQSAEDFCKDYAAQIDKKIDLEFLVKKGKKLPLCKDTFAKRSAALAKPSTDKDSEEDKSETAATKTDGAETPVVPSLDATKNPIPAKTNENTAEAGTKSENEAALEAQLQQTATDKAQLEQINQALQTQNSNLNASLCNLQGKGSLDDTFGLAAKSTENEANLTKISEAILKGRVEGAAKKVCAAPDRALAIEEELAQLDIPQDGELMSKSQARTLKSYIASLRAQSNNASVDPIDQRRMEMALAETAKTEALRKLAKQHTNLATLQRDLNQYSTEQLMGNGLETAFMYFSPNYVQVAADFASYYKVEEQKYRATHDFTKEVTEGAICASQLGVAAASRLLDATQQEENFMEPFRKASLRNALGAAMGSGSGSGAVRNGPSSKTRAQPQGI